MCCRNDCTNYVELSFQPESANYDEQESTGITTGLANQPASGGGKKLSRGGKNWPGGGKKSGKQRKGEKSRRKKQEVKKARGRKINGLGRQGERHFASFRH